MTIRREDLAAAAALGLLQYRQIDPLLVFLLQRDVHAQRQAMLRARERQRNGLVAWMALVAALLATCAGAMFAILLTRTSAPVAPGVAVLFMLVYAGSAYGAAVLARARGYGRRLRVVSVAVVASVPVAVFALQQVA